MATRSARPNYLDLPAEEFQARVDDLWDRYSDCGLCAHQCGVDRTAGETGVCRVDDTASVSSYGPHHGEEDVLRGSKGSGTIFLAHCNMACVFCQNADISQKGRGDPATAEEIAEMALDLQERGCHNVNFVSPTHHAPHLAEAVRIASNRGLDLPVVWNCGGYERADVLELLEGIVDIYMPDVKWSDDEAAATYSRAPNYWETARESLREMYRQVGDLAVDDAGVATEGLLIRHLVMPGHVENAKRVLTFLAEELGQDTFVNVMGQYRPHHEARTDERYEEINRRITGEEYRSVLDHADQVGLERVEYNPRIAKDKGGSLGWP